MNRLIDERNLQGKILCDSAGIGAWHVGNPPDRRMAAAARQKLSMELKGAARQFQPSDLDDFDVILAMDRENYSDIMRWDKDGRYAHKVKMMCDYCSTYSDDEVPDPYYGGPEGFNYVLDLLMDACSGLLDKLEDQQAL